MQLLAASEDSVTFEIYDEDWGKSDDFLGMCTLRFQAAGSFWRCLGGVPDRISCRTTKVPWRRLGRWRLLRKGEGRGQEWQGVELRHSCWPLTGIHSVQN